MCVKGNLAFLSFGPGELAIQGGERLGGGLVENEERDMEMFCHCFLIESKTTTF